MWRFDVQKQPSRSVSRKKGSEYKNLQNTHAEV